MEPGAGGLSTKVANARRPSASQRSADAWSRHRRTHRGRAGGRPPSFSRRCSASAVCSSTRSRPSTAATASRSGRVWATTRSLPSLRLMREGRIFEYWAHEACLLPIKTAGAPLPHGAARGVTSVAWQRLRAGARADGASAAGDRRARAARVSRDFEGSGAPGGMWNWKPAKVVLEALHSAGRLVIAGREELPAPLRPAGARRAAEHLNGGDADARRVRPLGDAARRAGPRRAHRGGGRGDVPAARAAPRASARTRTRSSTRACFARLEVEDGKAPVVVPGRGRGRRLATHGGRADLAVRQPASGTARSWSVCSASGT